MPDTYVENTVPGEPGFKVDACLDPPSEVESKNKNQQNKNELKLQINTDTETDTGEIESMATYLYQRKQEYANKVTPIPKSKFKGQSHFDFIFRILEQDNIIDISFYDSYNIEKNERIINWLDSEKFSQHDRYKNLYFSTFLKTRADRLRDFVDILIKEGYFPLEVKPGEDIKSLPDYPNENSGEVKSNNANKISNQLAAKKIKTPPIQNPTNPDQQSINKPMLNTKENNRGITSASEIYRKIGLSAIASIEKPLQELFERKMQALTESIPQIIKDSLKDIEIKNQEIRQAEIIEINKENDSLRSQLEQTKEENQNLLKRITQMEEEVQAYRDIQALAESDFDQIVAVNYFPDISDDNISDDNNVELNNIDLDKDISYTPHNENLDEEIIQINSEFNSSEDEITNLEDFNDQQTDRLENEPSINDFDENIDDIDIDIDIDLSDINNALDLDNNLNSDVDKPKKK